MSHCTHVKAQQWWRTPCPTHSQAPLFASGTCDRALAPFEPCNSMCVSHAKWRTDVVYGQSNIVLRCLHCTWWYGANRGICQMQSGVMEGRDKGGDRGTGREWGTEQLEPCQTLFRASAVGRQRPKHASTPALGELSSERRLSLTTNPNHTEENFKTHWTHRSVFPWGYLNCGWFTACTEMLHSKEKGATQMHKISKIPRGQILIKGKRHSALHFCVNCGAISFLLLFSKPIKRSTRSE